MVPLVFSYKVPESSLHSGRLKVSYGSIIFIITPCKIPQSPLACLTSFVFTGKPQPNPATTLYPCLSKDDAMATWPYTCTCLRLQMYHATQPQNPTSPAETSTTNFQETPKATETIHPPESEISSASAWQRTWPSWSFPCFPSKCSALQYPPILLHLKTKLQIPLHSLLETRAWPQKEQAESLPQISCVRALGCSPTATASMQQPWWQLPYSLCISLPATVHFTLLNEWILSHSFKMEIHTYNIHWG